MQSSVSRSNAVNDFCGITVQKDGDRRTHCMVYALLPLCLTSIVPFVGILPLLLCATIYFLFHAFPKVCIHSEHRVACNSVLDLAFRKDFGLET